MLKNHWKVALVDDNLGVLEMIASLLEGISGCVVMKFDDPQEALEDITDANGYDLIITDLNMPRMNGVALIQQLHQEGFNYHCILYSASPDELYKAQNLPHVTVYEKQLQHNCEEFKSLVLDLLVKTSQQTDITNLKCEVREIKGTVAQVHKHIQHLDARMLTKEDLHVALSNHASSSAVLHGVPMASDIPRSSDNHERKSVNPEDMNLIEILEILETNKWTRHLGSLLKWVAQNSIKFFLMFCGAIYGFITFVAPHLIKLLQESP